MSIRIGFFDLHTRFSKLSEAGDALERFDAPIDWEMFRPELERIDRKERKSAAGRKSLDRVLMFKMLVLQSPCGHSDEALEYQVTDRLTCMRSLRIDLSGSVPDAETVRLFREQLRERKIFDRLFEQFRQALAATGATLNRGQMVDASFVEAPRQRNTRAENETIKDGAVQKKWTKQPATLRPKDIDARWTQKNDEDHYRYKTHVSIDRNTKLAIEEHATAANMHASRLSELLPGKAKDRGPDVRADSVYRSIEDERELKRHGFRGQLHERTYRGQPLTACQERCNLKRSRVWVRGEYGFSAMTQSGGMTVRSIGIERMSARSKMKALTYNLKRLKVLVRKRKIPIERLGVPA